MRLFVTGATGSVGRTAVPQLISMGHAVTALVRQAMPVEGCRVIVGNLGEIDQAAEEIAASDAIVHLASTRRAVSADVLRNDIEGTAALIDTWIRDRLSIPAHRNSTTILSAFRPSTHRSRFGTGTIKESTPTNCSSGLPNITTAAPGRSFSAPP